MSKPNYIGANVEVNVDTFSSFINKVNWIMDDMARTVVTVGPVLDANATNGALSVGNAHVQGILSSTVMTPDELRGGTISTPANLLLSSNVVPKANTTIRFGLSNNRVHEIWAVNTNILTLTANVATITTANVTSVLTAANANITNGEVANLHANLALIDVGTVTDLTSTNAAIATAIITNANVGTANVTTANIGTARITTANVTTANAVTVHVTSTLTANNATVANANMTTANATTATIGTAKITTANVTTANAATVHVTSLLTAANANITNANVNSATVTTGNVVTLTSNSANITNVTSNVATINTATVTTANVNSAQIASGNVATLSSANATVTALQSTNATVGTLRVTGNLQVDGVTSLASNNALAVNTSIATTLTVNSLASLNGNTVIGDANTDSLIVNAKTTQNNHIVPGVGGAYNIGDANSAFQSLFVNEFGKTVHARATINLSQGAGVATGSVYSDASSAAIRKHDANGVVHSTLSILGAANTDLKYNGSTVWTAANDGSGSGLDAGLLEGQNAAYYRNATNINAGTIGDSYLPTSMGGKTFTGVTTVSPGNQAAPLVVARTGASSHQTSIQFQTANTGTTFNGFLGIHNGDLKFGTSTDLSTTGKLVWHEGKQGSGSGMDADKLDGQEGAWYRDLGNSTGTLPNSAISGAYDGITTLTSQMLRLTNTSDASETSTAHALQIGPTSGENLRIDTNEILTVNNGAKGGKLYIQNGIQFEAGVTLAIADGGTGANTAAGARSALGLAAIAASGSASDLTTGIIPNSVISGAYDGITTLGMSGRLSITGTGEMIRINSGNATSDPYISFFKNDGTADVRQGYIQHSDGTSSSTGLRLWNDIGTAATGLVISNDGDLYFYDGAAYRQVHHGGGVAFNTTGNITMTNSAPYISMIDTTTSAYSSRIYTNSNNFYVQQSADNGTTWTNLLVLEMDTNNATLNGNAIVVGTRTLTAGNGLTGGGDLTANRTFALGTPSDLSATSSNAVTSTSHTHNIVLASTADVRSNTNGILSVNGAWAAAGIVTISAASTVTIDFSTLINGTITLGSTNTTFANPTGTTNGQSGFIRIVQNSTTARTVSFGTAWYFENGITPTVSTALGSINFMFYQVYNSSTIYCTIVKGLA